MRESPPLPERGLNIDDGVSSKSLDMSNVLLAKSNAHDWRVCAIQVVFIVIWHWIVPTLTLSLAAWDGSVNTPIHWRMREDPLFEPGVFIEFFCSLWAARALFALVLGECVFGFIVFRIVSRKHKPPVGVFLQLWWLMCLWGTAGVPIGVFLLIDMISTPPAIYLSIIIWLVITAIIPSLIFRSDMRSGQYRRCASCGFRFDRCGSRNCTSCDQELQLPPLRMNRWRPVCPDCGYSLRKLKGERCPECGGAFPTDRKSFRRWAFHRLPWDQSDRGYLPTVYLKSIVCILFTPKRAARGLSMPDRWGRSIRWVFFHLANAVLVAVLLTNYQYYIRYVITRYWPDLLSMPIRDQRFFDSPDRVAVWFAQAVIAWTIKFGAMVGIASLISYHAPGRHRAAKRSGVKWAMYSSVAIMAVSSCTIAGFVTLGDSHIQTQMLGMISKFTVTISATAYGWLWAIGIGANPFNRWRGCSVAVQYAMIYFAIWLVCSRLVLNSSPLGGLL